MKYERDLEYIKENEENFKKNMNTIVKSAHSEDEFTAIMAFNRMVFIDRMMELFLPLASLFITTGIAMSAKDEDERGEDLQSFFYKPHDFYLNDTKGSSDDENLSHDEDFHKLVKSILERLKED